MKTYKIIISLMLIALTSCVQEEHLKTITFAVDMNGITVDGVVGIRGQFPTSNWQKTIPMNDPNGDGIYEVTFTEKTAKNSVEFKFINGDTYELQGLDNRVLKFEYKPQTIRYDAIFNNPNTK